MAGLQRLAKRKTERTPEHPPQREVSGEPIALGHGGVQDAGEQRTPQPPPDFRAGLKLNAGFPVPVVGKI